MNASPVGMRADDPLPVDAGRLVPGAIVADVIVHETELLRRAAALGCRTIDGTGMMDHQFYGYPYYDYGYDDSYYGDGGCYVVQRRVHTRFGRRIRPVQVCA